MIKVARGYKYDDETLTIRLRACFRVTGVGLKSDHVSHSRPHRRSPAASHAVPSTAEVGPGMVPMWLSAEVTYSTTNHDPLL